MLNKESNRQFSQQQINWKGGRQGGGKDKAMVGRAGKGASPKGSKNDYKGLPRQAYPNTCPARWGWEEGNGKGEGEGMGRHRNSGGMGTAGEVGRQAGRQQGHPPPPALLLLLLLHPGRQAGE